MDELERLCEELTQLHGKLPATMAEAILLLIEVNRLRDKISEINSLNKSADKTS